MEIPSYLLGVVECLVCQIDLGSSWSASKVESLSLALLHEFNLKIVREYVLSLVDYKGLSNSTWKRCIMEAESE